MKNGALTPPIYAIIQPTDLEYFIREAYAIALGFDLLMSTAYHKIYMADRDYLNNSKKITAEDIALRTIRLSGIKWRECRAGGKRAVKTGETEEELWADALVRANNKSEFLLSLDSDGFPSKWEFPSIR